MVESSRLSIYKVNSIFHKAAGHGHPVITKRYKSNYHKEVEFYGQIILNLINAN